MRARNQMWKIINGVAIVTVGLTLIAGCGGERPEQPAPPAQQTTPGEETTATLTPEASPAADAQVAVPELQSPAAGAQVAVAELQATEGQTAQGIITFSQADGKVKVVAEVSGVSAGKHGIHLHETGACEPPAFESAGGHFNPAGAQHGCPGGEDIHVGDFGNIEVGEDGNGRLELEVENLTLGEGEGSVVDKAVVLHAMEDDCTSQPAGNSGDRIACGIAQVAGAMSETGRDEPVGMQEDTGETTAEGGSE